MAFTLKARGPFSLDAAGAFAESFPGTEADRPAGELRFAWAVDDDWRTVTATVRQRGETARGELDGTPPSDLARRARRDVERILCLGIDGTGFPALGDRDPAVGALHRRFLDLRPVLFYTPYEAAAWAIIGHRIRITQAATIKQRLADELGHRTNRARSLAHDAAPPDRPGGAHAAHRALVREAVTRPGSRRVRGPPRSVLVTSTAAGHRLRRVGPGSRTRSLRRAFPRRRALGRGIVRAGPRSRRIFGVKRGRVRWIAVADRRLLRRPAALRHELRRTGLR